MRLAGITDIAQANEALNHHVKDFNDQFALSVDYTKSVFVEQPSDARIDQILAVLAERTIDYGQCIRYDNKHYRVLDSNNVQINFRHGTKGLVAKTFSGQMFFTVDDRTYALDEIPIRAERSEIFDMPAEHVSKPKKVTIPASNHPWRQTSFTKHHQYIAKKFYLEVWKKHRISGAHV